MKRAIAYHERRRHLRKPCLMNVGLDDYENLSTGKMHNLCRGGAYIEMTSGKGAPIGRELIVTILNKRKADFLILRGKVAWRNGNGIGVEFIRA